jgi:Rrf2 family protein
MFRLYSRRCEYALRALIWAANHRSGVRFQAAEVCREVGVPESYSRKVFQDLTQGGFLTAVRGPGGGYALSQSPEEIAVLDVIYAVDGPDCFSRCVMGLPECGTDRPCPLHTVWADVKKNLLGQLSTNTLQELADVLKSEDAANDLRKARRD